MTAAPDVMPITAVRDRVRGRLVGRERELDLVLAAVAAGRDIVLEGPPGTSKSTLLRGITAEWGIPLVFVEGDADLTPAKLVGHHNPARCSPRRPMTPAPTRRSCAAPGRSRRGSRCPAPA